MNISEKFSVPYMRVQQCWYKTVLETLAVGVVFQSPLNPTADSGEKSDNHQAEEVPSVKTPRFSPSYISKSLLQASIAIYTGYTIYLVVQSSFSEIRSSAWDLFCGSLTGDAYEWLFHSN